MGYPIIKILTGERCDESEKSEEHLTRVKPPNSIKFEIGFPWEELITSLLVGFRIIGHSYKNDG